MREITFGEALNEAIMQEMETDPNIFIYGIGVPDHKEIFGSVKNIAKKFGPKRCLDMPLSEDSMMGVGIGAAINGLKPIYIHIRVDFLLLAMNQLINIASTYNYMTGLSVPLVVRAIVGRGWGQGMQHSKSLQSMFAHIPGLKVVMPTTAYDAKGLLISAIRDPNPVIVLEHRWLYWATSDVPENPYEFTIGKAVVRKEGKDLTIVATSWMNVEAKRAISILEREHGLSIELIDPLTISPLDKETIVNSAMKTKNVIVADNDWVECGFSSEVASVIYENCYKTLETPISRIGFAPTPCPTARKLENVFYPSAISIVREAEKKFDLPPCNLDSTIVYSHENKFKGPF
jgi:acetoin:2,6-dichlorophenolindophenol oxidoreductase subunit beta